MKRTVFYARVSTDSDVQLHSLSQQRDFFMDYIKNNSQYVYCGEYIDEGLSGTSMKKRTSFNKMINDALNHQFDLILVKDISRFSRNTLDTINQTRKLKKAGIDVIFINDHIDTSHSDSEINLTLMATIAQEESRKNSHRVNWGMQNDMKNGVMFIESIYGYDVIERQLIINENQAKVVKLIYQLYLEGYGYYRIVMKLKELGIESPKGKKIWNYDTIKKILTNEKYIGTLVSGKTHIENFISKKQVYTSKDTRYEFKNHHDAIISIDTFHEVQILMEKKNKKYTKTNSKKSNHLLKSKVICSECQGTYIYDSSHERLHCKNVKFHICQNTNTILEKDMKEILRTVFNDIFLNKKSIEEKVMKVIKTSVSYQKAHQNQTQCIKKINRLKKYQEEYLNRLLLGEISSDEYKKLERVNLLEIKRIENELALIKKNNCMDQFEEMLPVVQKELSNMLENSDDLLKKIIIQFINKIIIRNRNDFDIYMNSISKMYQDFDPNRYTFFLELNYDFSYLESKYTQTKYKNLKNTRICIYQ